MYDILDEHQDFLVLNKAHGVCVHTEDDQIGLLEQLKKDFPQQQFFPVHRLDKVTSGILLVAKNHHGASVLSQLFQRREISKYYLAISDHKPKKKQGLIKGDMERSRRGSWKLCHSKNNPAVTQFFSHHLESTQRLFIVKPTTGKTHQIRVALKSIGAPIIGDRLYGHSAVIEYQIYLHAFSLSFEYEGVFYNYVNEPNHWLAKSNELVNTDCLKEKLSEVMKPWQLPWPTI